MNRAPNIMTQWFRKIAAEPKRDCKEDHSNDRKSSEGVYRLISGHLTYVSGVANAASSIVPGSVPLQTGQLVLDTVFS